MFPLFARLDILSKESAAITLDCSVLLLKSGPLVDYWKHLFSDKYFKAFIFLLPFTIPGFQVANDQNVLSSCNIQISGLDCTLIAW